MKITSNPLLDSYRQWDFPLTLYRVHYPGAQASCCDHCGFNTASAFTPRHVTGLRNAVKNHLDWKCRTASPFISAFHNREHAVNWAQSWSKKNEDGPWEIAEIQIKKEDDVILFHVGDLVNRLGISVPLLLHSQPHSEYLFFRHIPPELIVKREHMCPYCV